MTDASGVGIVDAELVPVEKGPPHRLTVTSIGGLKVRRPDARIPYLNSLIYGDSGVGKTLLAGMSAFVPEMCPILLLDFEGGTHSLAHLDTDDILVVPDPDEERPLRWGDVQKIYNDLWKGNHPFKTVIMDSATEAQAVNMGHLLGYDGKVDIDAALPKFDEWNDTTSQMRRMFRGFRDLRMNTIFTALTYEEPHPRSTRETPRTIVRPSFSKKLRQEAPAFFDVVLYMYAKSRGKANVRFVQTDRDETITAKCRIPGVPMAIENPTMESLFDMMVRNPTSAGFVPGAAVAQAAAPTGRMMKKK